ncbi:MAG TPA: type II secretion system F family protein [Actinomycetota bacterium]
MNRHRTLRRVAAVAAGVIALLAAAVPSASAAATVRIRTADLKADGTVRLTVSVGGDRAGTPASKADFAVAEAGRPVENFSVEPLTTTIPASIALAIDVSGSTAGRPLSDAKAAAKDFVGRLPGGTRVGIVAFSDTAWVRTGITADRGALRAGIDGLKAGGGTALYDGIALAAGTLAPEPGQKTIVVFSDGRDTAASATAASAAAAATKVGAPVTAVMLATKDTDRAALTTLAGATRGSLVEVGASAGLAAAFSAVASEIASQFVISYKRDGGTPQLELTVGLGDARDAIVVANPRTAPTTKPAPPPATGAKRPPIGALSGTAGLAIGLAAAFAFVALFGSTLFRRAAPTPGMQSLTRGIRASERRLRPRREEIARDDESGEDHAGGAMNDLRRVADGLMHRVPRMQAIERSTQKLLERASWPMRASEFLMVQAAIAIGSFVLAAGLLGRWWIAAALGVLGAMSPRAVLSGRIAKRQAAFLEQLPDTLTLLAGTLKAGYGFMQALDVLVQETPQPTAGEFSRVLTEARLGMPLDGAMTSMAERTGSEDFRWVVLAINIQRQTGGNLADLLTTVAQTLRDREAVRRQIKTLSAEGRLSAIILGALPFVIAGYISVVNPGYLSGLFSSGSGKVMIVAALGLMGLGIAWIRKIIRIDV